MTSSSHSFSHSFSETVAVFMSIDAAIGSLRGLRYDFGKAGRSLYVELRDIMKTSEDGEASRREILLTIEKAANHLEGSLSCLTKPERARKALRTIDAALATLERDKAWGR
jgi:hypothetical protein